MLPVLVGHIHGQSQASTSCSPATDISRSTMTSVLQTHFSLKSMPQVLCLFLKDNLYFKHSSNFTFSHTTRLCYPANFLQMLYIFQVILTQTYIHLPLHSNKSKCY